MSRFVVFGIITVFFIFLNFVGGWVNRVLREKEGEDQKQLFPQSARQTRPQGKGEETLGQKWLRVIRPSALLGLILFPLLILVVIANVSLIRLTLEIVFNSVPDPLLSLTVVGQSYVLTIFDVYGVLISLGEVITAAVVSQRNFDLHGPSGRRPEISRAERIVATLGLLALAVSEICASAYRSYVVNNHELWAGVLGTAVATGTVLLQVVAGLLVINCFVVPLLHAVGATIYALLGAGSSVLLGAFRTATKGGRGRWRGVLVAFDEVLIGPLRKLDELVSVGILDFVKNARPAVKVAFITGLIFGILLLTGCVSVHPAPALEPITFYLGLDETDSVPESEFLDYPRMATRFVLAHARARDDLFLIPVLRDPRGAVIYQSFDRVRVVETARTFCDQQLSTLRRPERGPQKPKFTDLGAVMSYVIRTAKSRGAVGRNVAVILSDGAPTGPQTVDTNTPPKDLRVWFVGVHPDNERALRQLTARFNFPDSAVEIVLYGGWLGYAGVFGNELHRLSDGEIVNVCRG
jgi:hypothetical protein